MERIAIISLVIVLSLIPVTALCCDSDSNVDEGSDIGITKLPEGFTWYQNDELGFKIAYPEDWYVNETQHEDELSVSIHEYQPNITPARTEGHISVRIGSPFDLSIYDDVESKEELLINGRLGYTFIWKSSYTDDDDDEVYMKKYSVTVLDFNGKYYSVACVCLEDVWDEKAPIFDTAIRSFVINENFWLFPSKLSLGWYISGGFNPSAYYSNFMPDTFGCGEQYFSTGFTN